MPLNRKMWAARPGIVLLAGVLNAALWVPGTNVLSNMFRERPTLLGRYSMGQTMAGLAVLFVSAMFLFVALGPEATRRRRLFGVITVGLALTCSLLVADAVLRLLPEPTPTEWRAGIVVRKPDCTYTAVHKDQHPLHSCYPCLPPGYPPLPLTFRVDHRGFRNPAEIDTAGVVLIGDSFTEGYAVSDDQPWGRLFSETTTETVCNLGNNGASPPRYWQVFNTVAMELKPHTIMLMLFEGNDFWGDGTLSSPPEDVSPRRRLQGLFRHSPLRERTEKAWVKLLGPINAPRTMPDPDVISCFPLAIPPGPNTHYYWLEPKRPLHLSIPEAQFRESPGWQTVALLLDQMSRTCQRNGVRFIVLYAPAKAHVVMPLVLKELPPEQVARFVLLRGQGLPGGARDGSEFLKLLAGTLDAQEKVTAEYCRDLDVEFLSFTDALRQATRNGTQTYFTYDMHWTPDGHRVVADTLVEYWRQPPRSVSE